MEEKRFHREQYPMDTLKEFGLTREMINDLPDFVHDSIQMGGKSPLLPICFQQKYGEVHTYARFCLVETDKGIDVIFMPKLKTVNLDAFPDEERELLLKGKVIVADIIETLNGIDGVQTIQQVKAFVQLDKDTNSVVYSHTPIIGRNLTAVSNEYDITGEELQTIWNGNLVTVKDTDSKGTEYPVTIGVDLFTDKGVIVVPGTADRWERTVRQSMPEYSFGNYGCWVNRKGHLRYYPDNQFTQDIRNALERSIKRNSYTLDEKVYIDEHTHTYAQEIAETNGKQLTH